MRICKIYDADYPWDIRVEKILSSLVQHGHEMHLVCRNVGKRPVNETIESVHIHRLPAFGNRHLNYFLSFPAFLNPIWLARIHQIVRDYDIQLILVRDLPMALAGILAGKTHRIPVIFDMAENYPAMLRHLWKYDKFKPLNILVRNPFAATAVQRVVLKHADHILVVIDESKEHLIRLGVDARRIHVLPNTPRISHIFDIRRELLHEQASLLHSDFTLTYVGGIGPGRGLDRVFYAIPDILAQIPRFRFVIIGSWGGSLERLESLAQALGVTDHVGFMGWVDPKDIPTYLALSDAGIIPHCRSEHTQTTIPNKLFDYMALGKPVIASDIGPIKRIIEKEECGLIFRNPSELAESVVEFFSNRRLRERMGENGRKAIRAKYNWESNSKVLIDLLEQSEDGPG